MALSCSSRITRRSEVGRSGGASTPQDTEGGLLINSEKRLLFESKKGSFEIPFDHIVSLCIDAWRGDENLRATMEDPPPGAIPPQPAPV